MLSALAVERVAMAADAIAKDINVFPPELYVFSSAFLKNVCAFNRSPSYSYSYIITYLRARLQISLVGVL